MFPLSSLTALAAATLAPVLPLDEALHVAARDMKPVVLFLRQEPFGIEGCISSKVEKWYDMPGVAIVMPAEDGEWYCVWRQDVLLPGRLWLGNMSRDAARWLPIVPQPKCPGEVQ